MSDRERPARVLIERDGKTLSWGEEGYLRIWNGLKYTLNVGVLKSLTLPVAIVFGIFACFSGTTPTPADLGSPINTPGVTAALPLINPPILVKPGQVNVVGTPGSGRSAVGAIRVFNLSELAQLPAGTEAQAVLDTGASNGIVKARLTTSMLVNDEPVLPAGTVIFGHGKSGEERLYVEFNRAILPTGESYPIRAQAFDGSDQILGLKGSVVGSKAKKMGLGMLLGFMGGMADGLQNTSGSYFAMPEPPSVRDAALAGTAKATLDQSNQYLDEVKNAPEIIEVKQGTELYVMVDEPAPQPQTGESK